MISRLLNTATLGRVVGFTVVVVFVALLASPLLQQTPGPGPTGSPAPAENPTTDAPPGARVVPVDDAIVSDGLRVAFAAKPAGQTTDLTEVSFDLADATTGQPVTPATPPAVWISRQQAPPGAPGSTAPGCEDRIRSFAQGTFGARPEIDLTSYFVLALNDDATISVIDPLNGVAGISQLYAMVLLAGRGEDWVLTNDGRRLFVSMPEIDQVAVVDTTSFSVVQDIDVPNTPTRVALQPDGRHVWVLEGSTDGASRGVTVIDVATLATVARLNAGAGKTEIAFTGEAVDSHGHAEGTGVGTTGMSSYAFIASRGEGTVSIVDAQRLEAVAAVDVGAPVTGLGYASASNAVYVAVEGDGGLTVVDASRHQVVGHVDTSPGVESVRFAPGGRWGFAISPANDTVDVIDATTNRVVHTVPVPGAPDRVAFSATQAYVHASERSDVVIIDLAQAGRSETLGAVRITGGQMPPDQSPVRLSVADPIVPVYSHGGHMLIANPGDKSIYYYMEGMNAPMGAFGNYGRAPRAVSVVDRSIREAAPGVYAARVRVPGGGVYQVAFQLDSPRVVHCFAFTTEPGSPAAAGTGEAALDVRFLSTEREVRAGEPLAFKVAVVDPSTNELVSGIVDLQVMATLASGQRSERFAAAAVGRGTYEVQLQFAIPGTYTLYFAIASRDVGVGDLPSVTVRVTPAGPE